MVGAIAEEDCTDFRQPAAATSAMIASKTDERDFIKRSISVSAKLSRASAILIMAPDLDAGWWHPAYKRAFMARVRRVPHPARSDAAIMRIAARASARLAQYSFRRRHYFLRR